MVISAKDGKDLGNLTERDVAAVFRTARGS